MRRLGGQVIHCSESSGDLNHAAISTRIPRSIKGGVIIALVVRGWRIAVALVSTAGVAVMVASSVASGSTVTAGVPDVRCASGSVSATIDGKSVCLRQGRSCVKRLDRRYHRYGFHCHNGRLTRAKPASPKTRPAGKVVATIPAPHWGGITVGGGAIWVANTFPHTVTRIDPESNAVVATIPVSGEADPFHGPTRMGFGNGTLWVLDGTFDCSCLHRIDPMTNREVATIRLSTSPDQERVAPLGIAVQPDAIWIALRLGTEDAVDGAVVRVDPLTNTVAAVISAGTSPEFGGPTRIAAGGGAVWATVPSMKSVLRIDPKTDEIVATVPGLSCGEGDVDIDASGGVWVADCDVVRRIDPVTNQFTHKVRVPSPTLSADVRGLAFGLGSVWAQSDVLARIDPTTGKVQGTLPLDPALVWGDYSIAIGFGSVWVRQRDRILRINP